MNKEPPRSASTKAQDDRSECRNQRPQALKDRQGGGRRCGVSLDYGLRRVHTVSVSVSISRGVKYRDEDIAEL